MSLVIFRCCTPRSSFVLLILLIGFFLPLTVPAVMAQEEASGEEELQGSLRSDTLRVPVLLEVPAWLNRSRDSLEALDAPPPWEVNMTGQLSASQVSYRNWAEGGLNTLSMTLGLDADAERTTDSWEQRHRFRSAFGVIQQDTLELRKADDQLRINSSLRYRGGSFFRTFNPTLAFTVRTQFAAGYNYESDPFERGPDEPEADPPVKVSDLMSPGTFRQSLGLTYEPTDWFTQRLGVAGQQTVTVIQRLRPLHGMDRSQFMRWRGGVEAVTEVDRELAENIHLQSELNLFTAFNDPGYPDLLWENVLGMQVNEWLSVDLEITAIYDREVSSELQLKEVLSLGVSFVFI